MTRVENLLIVCVEVNMVKKWVIYYYVILFADSVLMYSWPNRLRLQPNDCFMSSHGLNHIYLIIVGFSQDIPHLELCLWLISMIKKVNRYRTHWDRVCSVQYIQGHTSV